MNPIVNTTASFVAGVAITTMVALNWNGADALVSAENKAESYANKTFLVVEKLQDTKGELDHTLLQLKGQESLNEELKKDIDGLNEVIKGLTGQIEELESNKKADAEMIADLKNKLTTAEGTIADLTIKLEDSQVENSSLTTQLAEAKKAINKLQRDLDNANATSNYLTNELEKANNEIKEANQDAENHKAQIDNILDETILDEALANN